MSADLGAVISSFTPSNYFSLDGGDVDVGSGGMLLLPDQTGANPYLAVAGGKDGRAFLLDRDNMGGFTSGGPDKVLQTVSMGGCWCGPAYYVGSDGTPRVLTGGASGVTSWKLTTTPTTQLVFESATSSSAVSGLPDNGGVLPVVSSNGTNANTAIVWFVKKPASSSDQNPGTPITLVAFAASNLSKALIAMHAGTWVHAVNSNANLVPTVSNGHVYVASNLQLQIFGLLQAPGQTTAAAARDRASSAPEVVTCPSGVAPAAAFGGRPGMIHDFYGTVCQAGDAQFQVALRSGRSVAVDTTGLVQNPPLLLTPGRPVHVRAFLDSDTALHATRISHSHEVSPSTPADR